jgi:hypothetical protein
MFPEPKKPVNTLTNCPFTYAQFVSIHNQLRGHAVFSWVIDRFKSCNYDLKVFESRFKQQLKIEAIESYFKNQPYLAKDSVIDYFIHLAEAEEMPYIKINRFAKIYDEPSRRSFIKSWISATKRHLILTELRDLEGLDKLEETTDYLLELSYRIL